VNLETAVSPAVSSGLSSNITAYLVPVGVVILAIAIGMAVWYMRRSSKG
jgi:hypothetical protein